MLSENLFLIEEKYLVESNAQVLRLNAAIKSKLSLNSRAGNMDITAWQGWKMDITALQDWKLDITA